MEDSPSTTTTRFGITLENEENRKQRKHRSHFWPLLFYTLLFIVVCLTGFNFYLFCWLWSSLSVVDVENDVSSSQPQPQPPPSPSPMLATSGGGHNQWARIDTISSWNSININGRLANLRDLEAQRILASQGNGGRLFISSKNSIQMASGDIEFQQKPKPWLEMVVKENRIHWPNGLVVVGPRQQSALDNEQQKGSSMMRLTCNQETARCLVESPKVQLSHRLGVDFGRKSAQTPKVTTSRLHSQTNWLNLLSTNSTLFESKVGQTQLVALDELSLFSHNSAVILDANTIDVSRIRGLTGLAGAQNGIESGHRKSIAAAAAAAATVGPENGGKAYKLCICLPTPDTSSQTHGKRASFESRNTHHSTNTSGLNGFNSNNNNAGGGRRRRLGLVFAVKIGLNCYKFSESFCSHHHHHQQIASMN